MRRFVWVLAGLVAGLVCGCPDPTAWDPRGEVSWVQWREHEAEGVRKAQATCRITNTGRVALTAVELALSVKTDKETYYSQFHWDLTLGPGKSAYETLEIPYRDLAERGSLEGLSVDSTSFR